MHTFRKRQAPTPAQIHPKVTSLKNKTQYDEGGGGGGGGGWAGSLSMVFIS